MTEELDPRDKFNSLLVEYLNAFNLLEMNVGSCIRFLDDSSKEDSNRSLARTSCEKKLESLYEIVKSKSILKSERNLQELETWCENANKMRHQRNSYIHAVWSFLPHLDRVELSVAPWFRAKYQGSLEMSLQEFSVIVQEIKDCFEQLMVIRRKNGI